MKAQHKSRLDTITEFDCIALLLQGGGALGAYQAGVYEALDEAGLVPDWVGGISIGAVNGAIIAGNKPENRVRKLRGFWEFLTADPLWNTFSASNPLVEQGGIPARTFWNNASAALSMGVGVQGFFRPHILPPFLLPPGNPSATSFYDTGELEKTLRRFIDFDILNQSGIRYTTSAVNITSGNYTVFDTNKQTITPRHVMASGALPPALPAVEVDGRHFWDGGLISNTPLEWVMNDAREDTLVFQVDLWSAQGELPRDIMEVMTRGKEIQYSSRTRATTTRFMRTHKLRHAFATLYEKLPENLKNTEEAQMLYKASDVHVYNIVHLIYRARHHEGFSKDYEFSRSSMEDHWKAGYTDTVRSLRHKTILRRPDCAEGIKTFDVAEE